MGFVDWGDGLDDRLLGRLGRPPASLRSDDPEVEAWWQGLSRAEQRNFIVDVNRGVVFTDPIPARARVAAYGLQLRQQWAIAAGALVMVGLFAVALRLVGVSLWLAIAPAWFLVGLPVGRLVIRRRMRAAMMDAEVAEQRSAPAD